MIHFETAVFAILLQLYFWINNINIVFFFKNVFNTKKIILSKLRIVNPY
jgi:hypothetical protein